VLFKPKNIEQIISGRKTQTRRPVKEDESLAGFNNDYVITNANVAYGSVRLKWAVGRDYAIQPGRGKPCYVHEDKPLRIQLLHIHKERLQQISQVDAYCEGVETVEEFRQLWDSIYTEPGLRWIDNPEVWVLDFWVFNKEK